MSWTKQKRYSSHEVVDMGSNTGVDFEDEDEEDGNGKEDKKRHSSRVVVELAGNAMQEEPRGGTAPTW